MIKQLSENIRQEDEIAEEIMRLSDKRRIESLKKQLLILNDSLPSLIKNVELIKRLPGRREEKLIEVEYKKNKEGGKMQKSAIMEKDKSKFIVSVEESKIKDKKSGIFFIKLSNKLFFDVSSNLVNNGHFKKLNSDLRKANIRLLLNTYLSIMFFSSLIAFFFACLIYVLMVFFNISFSMPFFSMADSIGLRFIENLWIFLLPMGTYLLFYTYPGSEAKSIARKIEQELPFAVINMSAIASSGLNPEKIFRIITKSGEEYPNVKTEFEKVISYIELGEDITTALKIASAKTSSKNLKELFDGLANSIISGSSLINFLDKRAESLLFEYRLERERYTKLAETFMNIYISVVIAAPLVLMLTFFLMNLGGLGIGIGLDAISLLIVLAVMLINVFFILFLHFKQPSY